MSSLIFLNDYYKLIIKNRNLKRNILKTLLANKIVSKKKIEDLKQFEILLKNFSDDKLNINLKLEDGTFLKTKLSYEFNELEKDLFFLKNYDLSKFYEKKFSFFKDEVKIVLKYLKKFSNFNLFITDRDGTINNYSARYSSCIQSLYNAYYINSFVQNKTKKAIMVTSAPLSNPGILDSILDRDNLMIYAASKGREFVASSGKVYKFPISASKQKILDVLNFKLLNLLNKKEFTIFKFIGSGLQFKFGQTTIARQDISGSVKNEFSKFFMSKIYDLVKIVDPKNENLIIEDTGKDIEIILTLKGGNKDFNKANGLDFISKKLKLNFNKGPNLVCGDTFSDISLLEYTLTKSKNTAAIFVTEDNKLKIKIKSILKNAIFVSNPDVLVYSLYKYSKE